MKSRNHGQGADLATFQEMHVKSTNSTRPRRSERRSGVIAILAVLGVLFGSEVAFAQSCPVGSFCYYAPPILSKPVSFGEGYGGDFVLSAPSGTITGTYSANGGAAVPFTVTSGTPTFITLGANEGNISGFLVAEQRGTFIVSSSAELVVDQRMKATNWQSSSTVKSNVVGLGTRFRAASYSLNGNNGDSTGYDAIFFYAPTAATNVVQAPPGAAAPF